MFNFEKLEVWQKAIDFADLVYQNTGAFPAHERFGLTNQLRRAAISISSNIAEGSSRESKRDYLHFLYIARGSLSEAQYFIHLARRLGYLGEAQAQGLTDQTKRTFGCLHGLIQAVEKETTKISKLTATITSLLAFSLSRFVSGRLIQS